MDTRFAWSCVEIDCDYVVFGADEDAVVAAVMDHARGAHSSFELEEMILAAIEQRAGTDVPADSVTVANVQVAPRWATSHDADSIAEKKPMEWSPTRGYADL
jgi:predicted small metal-binding protein